MPLSTGSDLSEGSDEDVPSRDVHSPSESPQPSDTEYVALLPTLWHILTEPRGSEDAHAEATDLEDLLGSFIDHWAKSKPSSGIKQQGLSFLLSVSRDTLAASAGISSPCRMDPPFAEIRITSPGEDAVAVFRRKGIEKHSKRRAKTFSTVLALPLLRLFLIPCLLLCVICTSPLSFHYRQYTLFRQISQGRFHLDFIKFCYLLLRFNE